jgi:carbonic anhydrase
MLEQTKRNGGKRYLPALTAGILLFLGACATSSSVGPAEKHWGYTGDTGPAYWYELDPAYAVARDGKAQSPIDILTEDAVEESALQKPEFHYTAIEFEAENNGHTIEIIPAVFTNYIIIDNDTFILQQAHFHAPSEHRINGKAADAELHLVHKNAQGNIAVVGIFIVGGQENVLLHELFAKLPAGVGTGNSAPLEQEINLTGLLAENQLVYRYEGSLTTPPCSEGVKWSVASQPIELSPAQLAAFKTLYNGNSRPVQNLFTRKVYVAK